MRNAERGARWSRNRLIILVRIAQMETAARIKRGCIIRLVVMRGISKGVGVNNPRELKNISVNVESSSKGEMERIFDCGTDERKAYKLIRALKIKVDLNRYNVYMSVTYL